MRLSQKMPRAEIAWCKQGTQEVEAAFIIFIDLEIIKKTPFSLRCHVRSMRSYMPTLKKVDFSHPFSEKDSK